MPKIIPNLRENILSATRRRLAEAGPEKLTIASVATDCGVAVGTIYNYYESKEVLIASVIVDDWMKVLEKIRADCAEASDIFDGLSAMHSRIHAFSCLYAGVFRPESTPSPRFAFRERHLQLRDQLASCVASMRERFSIAPEPLLDTFIAESVLAWSIEGDSFTQLRPIYVRLLSTTEKE